MHPTGGFPGGSEANRAGMMRLVIGILLLILAGSAAQQGRWLVAAANLAFAALAGMLAYQTLPDRRPLPPAAVVGALAAGVILWVVSLIVGA